MITQTRTSRRIQRKKRIRATMAGSASRPRLSIFRSNKHLYVQLIDDENGKVLAAVSDRQLDAKEKKAGEVQAIAKLIAAKAKDLKLTSLLFDRSGYKYHGRVRILAEELRAQGLKF